MTRIIRYDSASALPANASQIPEAVAATNGNLASSQPKRYSADELQPRYAGHTLSFVVAIHEAEHANALDEVLLELSKPFEATDASGKPKRPTGSELEAALQRIHARFNRPGSNSSQYVAYNLA